MEPRPLNKPQRPAAPPPSGPPLDRGSWSPPASAPAPMPSPPPEPAYPGGLDASVNRPHWYEPGPAGGAPSSHGYSPGPALTPIDGPRGARFLGPVLALVVLAAVVIAVVFVIVRVFGDGDGRESDANLAAAATATSLSQAAPTGVPTLEPTGGPAGDGNAVAGAGETAAPDGASAQDVTPEPSPTVAEQPAEPEPTRATASARSMLPTTGDLPEGFQRTEDDKRVKEAVAASFADADEAAGLLDEWDWRENAYRTFEIPADAVSDPTGMTYVNISIHRFGREQGAKEALTYFADDVISTQGLEEFEVERIGEQTRALKGAPDGANLVVLYVRVDKYLIRIGGSSPQGDPAGAVIAIAEQIVE